MDIGLLSKMVGELILRCDEVGLPGVGTFVAEIVPSTFSDKGFTINPPYRRLVFHPGAVRDDSLVEFYAQNNSIDLESARVIIDNFLLEMKEVLMEKKSIIFPGLGKLRATKENNFFFVSDENLDIYPDGFGLEPVSLKHHQSAPDTVTPESVPKPVPAPIPAPRHVSHSKHGRKSKSRKHMPVSLIVFLVIILLAAAALGAFLLLAKYQPELIDSILYTKEELEILRW